MMAWVTDKKFLVGVALGFFVAPRLISAVRSKLSPAPAVAG